MAQKNLENAKRSLTDNLKSMPDGSPAKIEAQFKLLDAEIEVEELSLPCERAAVDWVDITVLFATDRTLSGLRDEPFTADWSNELRFGSAVVRVPTTRQIGDSPIPATWKRIIGVNAASAFQLRNIDIADSAKLDSLLSRSDLRLRDQNVLVFIHGFNTGFSEAVLRAAQIAVDLEFKGTVIAYAWPSKGSLFSYTTDEQTAKLAEIGFTKMLKALSAMQPRSISVLAHSMGGRVLLGSLTAPELGAGERALLKDIVFAAPDVDVREFVDGYYPRLSRQGLRGTIYVAAGDIALRASKIAHGYTRLGETLTLPQVMREWDVIEATDLAPTWRSFGHSYVFDVRAVLTDVSVLVRDGLPPGYRYGLREAFASNRFRYWVFRQ